MEITLVDGMKHTYSVSGVSGQVSLVVDPRSNEYGLYIAYYVGKDSRFAGYPHPERTAHTAAAAALLLK